MLQAIVSATMQPSHNIAGIATTLYLKTRRSGVNPIPHSFSSQDLGMTNEIARRLCNAIRNA
jgi:hypothetical protein